MWAESKMLPSFPNGMSKQRAGLPAHQRLVKQVISSGRVGLEGLVDIQGRMSLAVDRLV